MYEFECIPLGYVLKTLTINNLFINYLKKCLSTIFYWSIIIIVLMYLQIILFCFLQILIKGACPSNCICESKTLGCQICLSVYYQTYNIALEDCKCIDGFRKFRAMEDYCCPQICKSCYHLGCAICHNNAILYWNNTAKYYTCICKQNYYQKGAECECLSRFDPYLYYYNPVKEVCHKCPKNCTCNSRGCISCSNQTNRAIFIDGVQGSLLCQCIQPFIQIKGICNCPEGCICQNNFIRQCDKSTNRIQSYNLQWICVHPYKEIDGKCECFQPYQQIFFLEQIRCVCKSKLNSNDYYQTSEGCYPCGAACICNANGCISCSDALRFQQDSQSNCKCSIFATLVNGECVCLDPYYYDQQFDYCQCLNDKYPTQYFQDVLRCHRCPIGCKCSQIGCYFCQNYTLRYVSYSQEASSYQCECNWWEADEVEGICQCLNYKYYSNITNSCECKSLINPALAYMDQFGNCIACPYQCLCDERGCYQCPTSSLRDVVMNSLGIFQCLCKFQFRFKLDEQCGCDTPKQYLDLATMQCKCKHPYYYPGNQIDQQSWCLCKSQIDYYGYYKNFENVCIPCPANCLCNADFGCYQCHPSTLRFIDRKYQLLRKYNCPCMQNSYEINGVCTLCNIGFYYNGDGCMKCPLCLTCDSSGCLTCKQEMNLIGLQCVCKQNNFKNIDGVCLCPFGFYLNSLQATNQTNQCDKCPQNCLTCVQNDLDILCLSCNTTNTNRQDVSESKCPCKIGYIQSIGKKPYCCHNFCGDCDETGCTSCSLYTFRTLVNKSCICQFPFQELSNLDFNGNYQVNRNTEIVCGCVEGYYYQQQMCFKCRIQCRTCQININTLSIDCTSCPQNSNRNQSHPNCVCKEGFAEISPQKVFCYSKLCKFKEQYCTSCLSNAEFDLQRNCVCKKGFYYSDQICTECLIDGCLECSSKQICNQCNQENSYLLAENHCLKLDLYQFFIVQSQQNLTIQVDFGQIFDFQGLSIVFYPSFNGSKKRLGSYILLTIDTFTLKDNILQIRASNPKNYSGNGVFSILLTHLSEYQDSFFKIVNVYFQNIKSQQKLSEIYSPKYIAVMAATLFLIAISIVTATLGYKYNQIVFYIQTLFIMGLFLQNKKLEIVIFLFNLRFCVFMFNVGSIFASIIPEHYIQNSGGNFWWLITDSNIIRNFDQLFIITLLLPILCGLGHLFYCLFIQNQQTMGAKLISLKKKMFRIIQLLFKVVMYPTVLFSINTIFSLRQKVYFHEQMKYYSLAVSLFFILGYSFTVIIFYFKGNLSIMYKTELLSYYIYVLLFSTVFLFSLRSKQGWLPTIIVLTILKDLTYFYLKRRIAKNDGRVLKTICESIISLQFVGTILSVLPFFLIYFEKYILLIIMTSLALILMSLIQFQVIYHRAKLAKLDKIIPYSSQNETQYCTTVASYIQE